jgi:hypothetical protein
MPNAPSIEAIADPREFPPPDAADGDARALHRLAEASLGADTGITAAARDAEIAERIAAIVASGDGDALDATMASCPSAAIYRHLWRALVAEVERARSDAVAPTLFAIPVVVVAASDDDREHRLDAVVETPGDLERILAEHGALVGNRQFALAGLLAAADAIDFRALPRLLKAAASPGGAPLDVAPAPIVAMPGGERVHLRFLVGSALAASAAALCGRDDVGRWGVPFTRALSRAIAEPGTSVVAMPRAPQSLPAAVATGRVVSREAAATLFASNAIRRMRASVGEPIATISAHRADGVRTRGELRVSLSSPLDPREAEGFRCPLEPLDRVADVATMLADVLAECRVDDVRWQPGVHADRDPATGLALLFKAGAAGPAH